MSRRDETVALRHMLDYAKMARRFIEGRERKDLDRDDELRLALIRAVEVIGEAAYRVSPITRERHVDIPWAQIIATRHRLIHG